MFKTVGKGQSKMGLLTPAGKGKQASSLSFPERKNCELYCWTYFSSSISTHFPGKMAVATWQDLLINA